MADSNNLLVITINDEGGIEGNFDCDSLDNFLDEHGSGGYCKIDDLLVTLHNQLEAAHVQRIKKSNR